MSDIAVQASFNSGEWAPALFARVDIIKYRSGAALLENWFVDYRGGASTRPGTRFVAPARDGQIRLIPFQETSEIGYVLVFTDHAIQFVYRGDMITENSFAITGATQAFPCVITVVGNNFITGDTIFVAGVVGMTQLNDRYFIVGGVSGSAVTLTDIFGNNVDSTTYTAYSSAGTAARLYTLVSPYAGTDLAGLKYAQNVDQMIICSPNYDPYVLTIISANNWTIAPIVIGSTADPPDTCVVSTSLAAGTVNYAYQVTSVDGLGQESLPSPIGNLANVQDLRTVAGSNEIQWDIADGAEFYRVYKADVSYIGAVPSTAVFGYIGFTSGLLFIDSNIAPDFSVTPPVSTNPFIPTGCITAITVTAPGSFTAFPKVFIQGTATTPAHAHAILAVQGTPTVGAAGTGYAVNDTLSFAHGVVLVVASIGGGGSIATFKAITIAPSNKGSLSPPGPVPTNPVTPTGTSGAGTGATANLVWGADSVVVDDPGAGYTAVPTIVIGATGSGATATATLTTSGNARPTVPGFFQERLVLASSPDRPQTFWMSHPGQFFNFNVSNPIRPDDAIEATLVAGILNTIQSIVSSTSGMLMLTDNGSWIVNGGSSGSAITTSAIVANAQSYNGANNVRPIVANYDVLYVQQKGSSVRDLAFNIYFNVFTGSDISIIPSHLFFGFTVTEWAWAEEPFKVVWAIRSDGVLLSLTFMKEQEFTAWAHHITDGTYLSIAAVTEPAEIV